MNDSNNDFNKYQVNEGLYSSVFDFTKKWRSPIAASDRDLMEKFTDVSMGALHNAIQDAYTQSESAGDTFLNSLSNGSTVSQEDLDKYPNLLKNIVATYQSRFGATISPDDVKNMLLREYVQDSAIVGKNRPTNLIGDAIRTPFVDMPASLAGATSDIFNFSPQSTAVSVLQNVAPFAIGSTLGVKLGGMVNSHADVIGNIIGESPAAKTIVSALGTGVAKGVLGFTGGVLGTYVADKLIDHFVTNPVNEAMGVPTTSPSLYDTAKSFTFMEAGLWLLKRFPLVSIGLFAGKELLGLTKALNFKSAFTTAEKVAESVKAKGFQGAATDAFEDLKTKGFDAASNLFGNIKGEAFEKAKTTVKDTVMNMYNTAQETYNNLSGGQKIAGVLGASLASAMLFSNTVDHDDTSPDPYITPVVDNNTRMKMGNDLGVDIYQHSMEKSYDFINKMSNGSLSPQHQKFLEDAVNKVSYIMNFTDPETRNKYKEPFKQVIDKTLNNFQNARGMNPEQVMEFKSKIQNIISKWDEKNE